MPKSIAVFLLIAPVVFGQITLTPVQIAKKVPPSVVVIQGKTDTGDVLGSGFIVSKDGKIVTNFHVIKDMKTASVRLANGEVFDSVSVLATDERRDLAVVQIAGVDLSPLELGDSDALTVGEPVVVVGTPQGFEDTVTAGILSSVRDTGEGFTVLQTDAAVNPGSSGGPLVNNKAQAIGVISFRLKASEGLNFAIPIKYVRGLLNSLHAPMPLGQARGSLGDNEQKTGPSLKETLEWLKEKLPLAARHYSYTLPDSPFAAGGTTDVALRTIPVAFESCTVSFDFTDTRRSEKYPAYPRSQTTRQTIPLGALTGGSVKKDNLNKVDNTIEASWVFLNTGSQVVLSESRDSLHDSPENDSKDYAFLVFFDESVAQRVLGAFKHAADLCRGKEAF
ncbi:MAG: S1C family serine protease [Bryobacteraceae bacterium]